MRPTFSTNFNFSGRRTYFTFWTIKQSAAQARYSSIADAKKTLTGFGYLVHQKVIVLKPFGYLHILMMSAVLETVHQAEPNGRAGITIAKDVHRDYQLQEPSIEVWSGGRPGEIPLTYTPPRDCRAYLPKSETYTYDFRGRSDGSIDFSYLGDLKNIAEEDARDILEHRRRVV